MLGWIIGLVVALITFTLWCCCVVSKRSNKPYEQDEIPFSYTNDDVRKEGKN